jgi:ABC-type lipoprotein export system ATPase subunit
MPRFKFALTIQQRNVLYRSGNLIIMGRSGTGKTTCAMLRLYGIEILIKMKEYNSLKK